ncbi:MAG: hypothetical protein ACI8YQ_001304 [Polaribacter sp.]|jgi:hypothetical protein
MKKIFITFLTALFIFPFLMNGQAPGYLGKKALVSFNYSVFPGFFGPSQNNRGRNAFEERSGKTGLNYEFDLGFDYVVGRYRSLGLHVGQYYTGTLIEDLETRPLNSSSGSFSSDEHDLLFRVNVRSASIILSRFKREKGGLAPIGNRFYWGFKRNFIKSEIIDKKTSYSSQIGIAQGHGPLGIDQEVAFNYLLFGWSNDQIFWDKVLFKTGFRMAVPLSLSYLGDAFETNPSSDRRYDSQYHYELNVFRRLMWHEFIRFDIGVGYLLF